jgi:hypothetical protein
MKINANVNIPVANESKARQDKKDKIQGDISAKDSSMVSIVQKNIKFNSYNISVEESEIITNALKDSFNNMKANIENLFSGINSQSAYSLLKENN